MNRETRGWICVNFLAANERIGGVVWVCSRTDGNCLFSSPTPRVRTSTSVEVTEAQELTDSSRGPGCHGLSSG